MDLRTTHTQKLGAAKAGISVASAGRMETDPTPPSARKPPRTWRTREDPLALVRDNVIVPILHSAPGVRPVTELDRRFPGTFDQRVRRTFEPRVRDWRALDGLEREIVFPQTHAPGRLGLSDFTD